MCLCVCNRIVSLICVMYVFHVLDVIISKITQDYATQEY